MELINSKRASIICRRDAKAVATDIEKFVADNTYQYYFLINLWGYMLHELQCDESIFLVTVERNGLLHCVDEMSKAGTSILASYPTIPNLPMWIADLVGDLPAKDAAQVLRFGKRFTLCSADKLEAESITNFLNVNNINKMRDRNGYPRWLTAMMRAHIERALSNIDLKELVTSGYFSPGAVHNSKKSEVDKVKAWSLPNFGSIEYPTMASSTALSVPADNWGVIESPWNDGNHDHIPTLRQGRSYAFSKAVAVPKSYKAYRIIAENDSTRQFFEQAVRIRMWNAMCANGISAEINLLNQGINATSLAMYGEEIATIDMSNASDRVTWALVASVFPTECVHVMDRLRSQYILVNGKLYPAYMAFTSGSALCFIVECLVFWALLQVARDICSHYTDKSLITLVYGDDLVVSQELYDTVIDLLGMINASVNVDKSYNTGHFRESCGADWLVVGDYVEYVTSDYWPRKAIMPSMESVESLLELNNRLFRYKRCHFFIRDQIRMVCKDRMTYTQELDAPSVVTDCLDLYTSTFAPCRPPYTREALKNGELPDNINMGKARIQECVTKKSIYSLDDPDVQMYYYTQYLMHGPLYEDALMELLRVSSPRRSLKSITNGISFDIRVTPVF